MCVYVCILRFVRVFLNKDDTVFSSLCYLKQRGRSVKLGLKYGTRTAVERIAWELSLRMVTVAVAGCEGQQLEKQTS
jgi:hypothetical protein